MATLNRNGIEIYYEEHGSGPAVMLSHAYGASSRMWSAQAEALKPYFRVVTWDMRGHGQSGSPPASDAYTEEATREDLRAILDHLGVESVVLGGLSLGGYMSLSSYFSQPARVEALMLFDTGPGFRDPAARERWNGAAFERAKALEERGLEAIGEQDNRLARHVSAQGLAHAARGMLAKYDTRVIESLEEVAVPTLILVGENDAPLLGAADYLAARIRNSKKVTIPAAGHHSNLDQPEAFNEAVLAFLSTLYPRPSSTNQNGETR